MYGRNIRTPDHWYLWNIWESELWNNDRIVKNLNIRTLKHWIWLRSIWTSEIWNSDRTLKHLNIWNLDHWYISETIKYRDSETLKWFWNIWISEPWKWNLTFEMTRNGHLVTNWEAKESPTNYYTPSFHFNRISKSHGKNHYHWAICDRQPCSLFQSDSENSPWENKCVTTPVYSSPFPLRCTQPKLSHC